MDSQFIYVSMDVNGLRLSAHRQGHAAGDELICGSILQKSGFNKYGKGFIE